MFGAIKVGYKVILSMSVTLRCPKLRHKAVSDAFPIPSK